MNSRSPEHRALKVATVNALSSAISIGMQLITVSICLKYWGKEPYGMWLALFSVSATLQTTGTGFVNYVGNRINLLYHQDQVALQGTLASSLAGVVVLAAIQLGLIAAIIAFDGLSSLIGLPSMTANPQDPALALLVLAGSWLLGGAYIGILHRLQIPTGMMYQAAWWSLGSQASLFLVVIFSAFFRLTLLETSSLFALVQFSLVFASALYIRFKLPAYFPWWRGFRLGQGLRDLTRSIPLTVSGMIQQGSSNGLVILVSALAGAAAVPVFTTVRTLANLWTNITNILTTPLLPDVVRFHAKGEIRKLLAVHNTHGVVVGSLVNLSILLLYPFIEPLYRIWTNNAVALEKQLLCALLAAVSLMNLGAMMNTFLTGINHHRSILSTTIARSSVSIMFGGIMLSYIGVAGLGLGVWAGELAALALLIHFFTKTARMHLASRQIHASGLGPALLAVVSVQVYLGMTAMDFPNSDFVYPVAIAGVLLATAWGWRRLDVEIRDKIRGMLGKRFSVKEVV